MRKKWNGYDFWRHCLLNRAHNIFSTVFFVSNTTVSLFSLCWSIFALIRQNVTSLFATSGIIWSETIIKTNIAYIVLFTPIGEPRYQYGLWLLDRSISNESVQIDFLINLLAHFFHAHSNLYECFGSEFHLNHSNEIETHMKYANSFCFTQWVFNVY